MIRKRERRRFGVGCGLIFLLAAGAAAQPIALDDVRAQLATQVRRSQALARTAGPRLRFPTFRKTATIHFIVDPRLARATSHGYTPYLQSRWVRQAPEPLHRNVPHSAASWIRTSLLDSNLESVIGLVRSAPGQPVQAYDLAGGAVRDFFEMFSENRNRHADLKAFLRSEAGKDDTRSVPLFTVAPRFWVEHRGEKAPLMCCRVEIRGFWMRLSRGDVRYPDLIACELFYQDSAEGRFAIDPKGDPGAALVNSVYAAFANGITVSFSLNASVQSAIARPVVTPIRVGSFRGVSVARQVEGRSR